MKTVIGFATGCLLLLSSFLSSFAADEPEVKVRIGKGQVEIQVYGLNLPEKWKKAAEATLASDRRLTDRILSSAVTEVRLNGDYLDNIEILWERDPERANQALVELTLRQLQGTSSMGDEVMAPLNKSFHFFLDSTQGLDLFHIFSNPAWWWGYRIARMVCLLLMTIMLILLAPDFFNESLVKVNREPLGSGLIGLFYLLAYVPVSILLVITIVGIFLLPLQLLITGYFLVVGCAAVMKTVLAKLMGQRELGSSLGLVAIAMLLFEVLGWIPYLGAVIHVVVSILGLGATSSVLWKRLWPSSDSKRAVEKGSVV